MLFAWAGRVTKVQCFSSFAELPFFFLKTMCRFAFAHPTLIESALHLLNMVCWWIRFASFLSVATQILIGDMDLWEQQDRGVSGGPKLSFKRICDGSNTITGVFPLVFPQLHLCPLHSLLLNQFCEEVMGGIF